MMVASLIKAGFGKQEQYNCAEKIIYAANQAYHLNLPVEACQLMAGFGGGMAIGSVCGAVCSCVAVLSSLYVSGHEKASPQLRPIIQRFLARYQQRMGSIMCETLKQQQDPGAEKCSLVILAAAEILDEMIQETGHASIS